MKVIFLDIDEVLNSTTSSVAYYALNTIHQSGKKKLDIVSIGLLKFICDVSDAKIVITSTWRYDRTMMWFKEYFSILGWDNFPIIDSTKMTESCRGIEIQMWLKEHPEVSNYAIIDDDSDMLVSQQSKFVNVCAVTGLTLKDALKVLRIFGIYDDNEHVKDLQSCVDFKKSHKHTNTVWMIPVVYNGNGIKARNVSFFDNPSYYIKYELPEDQNNIDLTVGITDNMMVCHYPIMLSD